MKKELAALLCSTFLLAACDHIAQKPATPTPTPNHGKEVGMNDSAAVNPQPVTKDTRENKESWFSDSDTSTSPNSYKADNTGRNARDRSGTTLTSGDQSESAADRTLAQKLRQLIINDEKLSMDGKNIKIIAIKGEVTLRGPVVSAQEKAEILRKIKQIEGVKNVDNQLEVVSQE